MLIKFYYKSANKLITNSKKASNDLKILSNSNVKTIYSPAFEKFVKKIKKKNFPKRILSVGRLSREKGYDTLIKAINLINNKSFILEIVGEGDQRKKLTKLIEQNKLKDQIFLSIILMQKQLFLHP